MPNQFNKGCNHSTNIENYPKGLTRWIMCRTRITENPPIENRAIGEIFKPLPSGENNQLEKLVNSLIEPRTKLNIFSNITF